MDRLSKPIKYFIIFAILVCLYSFGIKENPLDVMAQGADNLLVVFEGILFGMVDLGKAVFTRMTS